MEAEQGRRDFQRYLVMAINGERAAQGLTLKALAQRAGIVERTMLRVVHLERDMDFAQVAAIAQALGVSVSSLVVEAERRMAAAPSPVGVAPTREQVAAMLADPSTDEWLNHHLGELTATAGLKGESLQRVLSQARTVRRQQLTAALEAFGGSASTA